MKKYILGAFLGFMIVLVPKFTFAYTWTVTGTGGDWKSIASDASGQNLAGVVYAGHIFTSVDGGVTWTPRATDHNRNWYSIASNSTGSNLVAVEYRGDIYTSVDFGVHWTDRTRTTIGPKQWYSVASDVTGLKLVAVDHDTGYIYVSSDGGVNWVAHSEIPASVWQWVSSDNAGVNLIATTYYGLVYLSHDSGVTWAPTTLPRLHWGPATSDSTGTNLAVAVGGGLTYPSGPVYVSNNAGRTWHSSGPSMNWIGLTFAPIDQYLFAIRNGGSTWESSPTTSSTLNIVGATWGDYIYVSNDGGTTWNPETSIGSGTWNGVVSHPLHTVVTVSSTITSRTTATITGNLTATGGAHTTNAIGFNWGTTTAYGHTASSGTATSTGVFTANLTGLTCGTTYHFEATADNGFFVHGADMSFVMNCLPVVSISSIDNSSLIVRLFGSLISLDGLGGPDDVSFEYAHAYDTTMTSIPEGSMTAPGSFSGSVTLPCQMTYRFHAKAVNPVDPTHLTSTIMPPVITGGYALPTGELIAETTFCSGATPLLSTVRAVPSMTTAVLTGKLTDFGHGSSDKVYFGYGGTRIGGFAWQGFTPAVSTSTLGEFSTTITDLICGTEYHYRAQAEDGLSGGYGSDLRFTTLPCATTGGGIITTGGGIFGTSGGTVTGGTTNTNSGTTNDVGSSATAIQYTTDGCSIKNNTLTIQGKISGTDAHSCVIESTSDFGQKLLTLFATVFSSVVLPK